MRSLYISKPARFVYSIEVKIIKNDEIDDYDTQMDEEERKKHLQRYYNRQHSIAMVSKMAAIPTVTIDTQIKENSKRKLSVVPTLSRTLSLSISESANQRRYSRNTLRMSLSHDTSQQSINQKKKINRVRFGSQASIRTSMGAAGDISDDGIEQEGRAYTKSSLRKPTGMPQTLPVADFKDFDSVFDENEENQIAETEFGAEIVEKDDHKQNWSSVDHVAWVLLLTIAIECLIEGIAFVLTLQDTFGAGVAILVAMLVKLVPQKVGHAVILTSAGLNHFWENVFATLAVMTVYIGVILGIALEDELSKIKYYFFGALSGIFLYMSLASLFPVLQEAIDDVEINDIDIDSDIDLSHKDRALRRQHLRRLFLANLGFGTAMALVVPLIYYEHDLEVALQVWLCTFME